MAGCVHKEPSVLEPRLVSDGALWEVVLLILKGHQLAEGLQSYKNRRAGQTGLLGCPQYIACHSAGACQHYKETEQCHTLLTCSLPSTQLQNS